MTDRTTLGVLRSPPVCITLNSRSGRPLPTNERVHLSNVVRRLPNPVRKVRWTNAHTTQPRNPLRRTPWKFTMALNRPTAAALPRSRYLKGTEGSPFIASQDRVGRVQATLHGDFGHAGEVVERHHVADDEHLGVPRHRAVRQHRDATGPVDLGPVALASSVASGDASTPAAQTVV